MTSFCCHDMLCVSTLMWVASGNSWWLNHRSSMIPVGRYLTKNSSLPSSVERLVRAFMQNGINPVSCLSSRKLQSSVRKKMSVAVNFFKMTFGVKRSKASLSASECFISILRWSVCLSLFGLTLQYFSFCFSVILMRVDLRLEFCLILRTGLDDPGRKNSDNAAYDFVVFELADSLNPLKREKFRRKSAKAWELFTCQKLLQLILYHSHISCKIFAFLRQQEDPECLWLPSLIFNLFGSDPTPTPRYST